MKLEFKYRDLKSSKEDGVGIPLAHNNRLWYNSRGFQGVSPKYLVHFREVKK